MNRIVLAAAALIAGGALAQEIGTEIAPGSTSGSGSTAPTTYDNPYAPPPAPPPPPETAKEEKPKVPGPKKGAFGIRAGFDGASIHSLTGTAASAPTLGIKYFVNDTVGVIFDAGVGVGIGNRFALGFGAGVGVDAHLGSADRPIRPFASFQAMFGKGVSDKGDDFVVGLGAGGGGEYWFSDHFSVNGRLILGAGIDLKAFGVGLMTLSPGIGGTLYF
ncbi:MAG: hypothetical protein HYZ28_15515 [Myxococcales bacterium]|nr:hypothetical protein [Myxococcales bacterium]